MSVFRYTDYRHFVVDRVRDLGRLRRELAGHLKMSEPWVSRMLSRQLALPSNHIQSLGTFLELDGGEMEFFQALVALDSESEWVRGRAWRVVLANRVVEERTSEVGKEPTWSLWYVPAVFGLSKCEDFDPNPVWVSRALRPNITEEQALEAMDFLESIKVIDRNKRTPSDSLMTTGVQMDKGDVTNHFIDYHRQSLDRAKEAYDEFNAEERFMTSNCLALSEETRDEVRARVKEFFKELHGLLEEANDQVPTDVYQLSFQFFPLSESTSAALRGSEDGEDW
ncbi:MAG: DUF4423 domain-containing protein [Myxococcales bacterium]|nr:DUF4423 domain-containing protein [Myxococcales bacterium]